MIDGSGLITGSALWALALYLPLSLPLARFEAALSEGPLPPQLQTVCLVLSSLLLALAVGVITHLGIGWALGPGWSSSMAVIALVSSVFLSLASRADPD
ncbi:hypothetical protein EVJ50_09700 [Synechococcus sp. RSCCF101]|uniref:hypothetical protein n=1 Tax=Synechococcus sp. RSCCF101 TaxID=2511069 RepID=UPI001249459C|nr:hypothetical protein [Synechococcus sp. RSCCF101]QEY32451.1 hypothetical protein EVJ50_09700 [Synechococcus sp. RSCCF101]